MKMRPINGKVICLFGLCVCVENAFVFCDAPSISIEQEVDIYIRHCDFSQQALPLYTHIYDNDIYLSDQYLEIRYQNNSLMQVDTSKKPWLVLFSRKANTIVCEELFSKTLVPYYYYLYELGIPLHSTSLCYKQEVHGIMGESCSGKSTLAYYLLQDNNTSLISDDVSFLKLSKDKNEVAIYKSNNKLKLRAETAVYFSEKKLVLDYSSSPRLNKSILKTVFYLHPLASEQQAFVRKCSYLEATRLMLTNLYASYLSPLTLSSIHLIRDTCKCLSVFELGYYKNLSQLDDMKQLLITSVGEQVNE